MRLVTVQVTDFQSVRDSTPFDVGDVTCLVGKNEAGKTALLKAIYRLNPINASDASYDVTDDYPRGTVTSYEADVAAGMCKPAIVAKATFALDAEDIAAVTAIYGADCLRSEKPIATLCKDYANSLTIQDLDSDQDAAIQHLIKNSDLSGSIETGIMEAGSLTDKIERLHESGDLPDSASELDEALGQIHEHGFAGAVYERVLAAKTPKFLYFDDYYQLSGQANIGALQQRVANQTLRDSDRPLLGLIELAGLSLDQMAAPRRTEALIAKLEGAGNELTRKVLTYWSQNRHLRLKFDVRQGQPDDPPDMRSGPNILGRVEDTREMVTTPLGTRSRGFVWFFSFLAWYSHLRRTQANLILLLDEPGLSLHAKAQADLLEYFESELVPHHQVIYTTHSPFMVDPRRFERVRIVQDHSIEDGPAPPNPGQDGTRVTTDVLEASRDSLFPLQAALGYDLHQTLFIGPNSLVVEGASDLLYLQALSGVLQAAGRRCLSSEWTITPVGGLDKVPTFVALIGAQSGMNLATLVDYHRNDRQTIENLYKRKLMKDRHVLTFAEFVDADEADIEDMFTPEFYLELVNGEFDTSLRLEDLPNPNGRILLRLENHFAAHPLPSGARFNHYRPARYLMDKLGTLELPAQALDRFEQAFVALDGLLPP